MPSKFAFTAFAATMLAACSQAEPEQEVAANGETSASSEGDMTPDSVDVVEAASANDNLSTFIQVAVEAGVGETLAQADGITIFAPINEAFEEVEGLEELQQDRERMADLLKRHAVPSTLLSSDIADGDTQVETLSGETLTINNQGGLIRITTPGGTEAMVAEADITGDNGVVHAINTVLAD